MELKRWTDHIWIMPFEAERDRLNLGYVKGDNWSMAIGAIELKLKCPIVRITVIIAEE